MLGLSIILDTELQKRGWRRRYQCTISGKIYASIKIS